MDHQKMQPTARKFNYWNNNLFVLTGKFMLLIRSRRLG